MRILRAIILFITFNYMNFTELRSIFDILKSYWFSDILFLLYDRLRMYRPFWLTFLRFPRGYSFLQIENISHTTFVLFIENISKTATYLLKFLLLFFLYIERASSFMLLTRIHLEKLSKILVLLVSLIDDWGLY